ncbi:MAG: hypothetical protein ABSE66_07965 [Thermoplasmata archaeon]
MSRARKVDLALLIGCSFAVAIGLLVWTGVVPSVLYPSTPTRWSLDVPTCTYAGQTLPSVQHAFPLWATVHVQWTATGGDVWYLVSARGFTPISQIGTNGSGSFVSDSYPLAFWALDALPPNGTSCPSILVTTTVTYTL